MRKPSLLVIFLTVFIDLVGFGIVLPLLPRYSERFGAEGWTIGTITASFSVMQLFLAPWWGRLSDRIGRRPVLLISNAGSAVAYALFALAGLPGLSAGAALTILLGSRLFAGACGANISVASAYIADITPPEKRSKGMGLIGVSFGLGFILGPAIGALSFDWLGLTGPGWVASVLCAGNFILACFILAESRAPSATTVTPRPRLAQISHTLRLPHVGLLVTLYFLATFCFAIFETTLPLLLGSPSFHPDNVAQPRALASRLASPRDPATLAVRERLAPDIVKGLDTAPDLTDRQLRRVLFLGFNQLIAGPPLPRPEESPSATAATPLTPARSRGSHGVDDSRALNRRWVEDAFPAEIRRQTLYFDERHIGFIFAFCGIVSAFIQGGLIGRLVKRFGEPRLIIASLALFGLSLITLPWAAGLGGLLAALALVSAASGLNRAPTIGLVSIFSSSEEQGSTMGVIQSAGTLARIAGPVLATALYAELPHSPYWVGGGIAVAAAVLAWVKLPRTALPHQSPPAGPA